MSYQLITDSAALAAFCTSLKDEPFICVDTEFLRERTYFAQLCVVQVSGSGDNIAVIDALAPGLDLAPLHALLTDRSILKVLHAARQDIEIFYHAIGEVPGPLFDTQIAAAVLGYGEQIGYDNLVAEITGGKIDKSQRFLDWSHRPLSKASLDYAAGDVIHLHEVYPKLRATLERKDRLDWLIDEMAALENPDLYQTHPEEAWQRIKLRRANRGLLTRLQALAAWRESEAIAQNVPRSRLLKDETLLDIAGRPPESPEALRRVRGLSINHATLQKLFAAIEAAGALPPDSGPPMPKYDPMPPEAEGVMDLLKLLLKHCARDGQVAASLIASSRDVEALAKGTPIEQLPFGSGWRWQVFGMHAKELLTGEWVVSLEGGKLRFGPPQA